MRVVQLITQTRGGPVDHAIGVARELDRLGHTSVLVGPSGGYVARLAGSGVRWRRAEMGHKLDLAGARAVARVLAQAQPDVVHAQDRRAGLIGRLVAQRHGIASTYTLHGVPDSLSDLVVGNIRAADRSRRDRWANLTGERWLARLPRAIVVAPCEAVARYARDHVGLRPDRVVVVPNGISPGWAGSAGRVHAAAPTVAWLGVMAPVKRVEHLVQAVAGVPGLRLRLIGDGSCRPAVEAAISVAGVADRVEVTGFRADPARALAAADIFALPSAAEACPMAILQAMACGLPVVASSAGGIPEMIRDGVDGLLVPTGDDDALRSALHTLSSDPALCKGLGQNARQRVLQRFTIERCVLELLDVYREVAR